MAKQYDVVVIGAGNGGLVAAATCAKAGLSTLLIEKHNIPGGCATSFRRGRFEFEVSLHELCDYGPEDDKGDVRKLLEGLGANVQWLKVPDLFRVIVPGPDGYDATMPTGRQAFIDSMEKYVPGSRRSVTDFFSLADDVRRAMEYTAANSGRADPKVMRREHPNFLKTGAYSVNKVLAAINMPEKARNILTTYWGYLGADADTISFVHYARMLDLYVSRAPYIPKNRSHEISLALEKSVRDNGGDIWYNTEVTRIVTKNGRVCGVEAAGKKIPCGRVIANVIPHVVYSRMMDINDVPELELMKANARTFGSRGFVAYLGLNKSAEELGIKDYTVFLTDYADSVKNRISMGSIETNNMQATNCLDIVNPEASPEGTSIIYITSLYTEDAWKDVKPRDYFKLKNQLLRRFVEGYEKALGVRISDCVEEAEVSTPLTFARYIGTPQGTIYGYLAQEWDGLLPRLQTMYTEDATPGLRFCGGHSVRLLGYSATYMSGELAAKLTMKDINEGV